MLRFIKMNGAGNDFVVIDNRQELLHLSARQLLRPLRFPCLSFVRSQVLWSSRLALAQPGAPDTWCTTR